MSTSTSTKPTMSDEHRRAAVEVISRTWPKMRNETLSTWKAAFAQVPATYGRVALEAATELAAEHESRWGQPSVGDWRARYSRKRERLALEASTAEVLASADGGTSDEETRARNLAELASIRAGLRREE